jgi:subtilisin family serine protease
MKRLILNRLRHSFRQLKEIAYCRNRARKINLAPYTGGRSTQVHSTSATTALPFNDPLLKDQWHYDNTGQMGFSGADANLFEAWTKTTGANNIIVSVHDEGVDVKHADLKANIWTNLAELNGTPNMDDDGNGYVDDVNGYNFEKNKGAVDAQYHGTHVAGTIAAVNNNGIGVSGVAGGNGTGNGVKIMSMQILGGAAIENSYVYAANNGAVISQNSWGYTSPGYFDQSILDAIDYFVAEAGDYAGSPMKGGIVIFAAGNSNADAFWYPGYYAKTFSVSSVGPEGKKASYSNFGAWVEIAAPGGEMQLGSKNGVLSTLPGSKYGYLEGTSMACPHVSGVAALVLANRTSQLTPAVLWTKLLTGVVDIDTHNPDYAGKLGSGMLDANLAIQNNAGLAPDPIADLSLVGISQEFATITWKVPTDQDDGQPVNFRVLVHTAPITANNIAETRQSVIVNKSAVGESINFSVEDLLGQTPYYFAVLSTDRWNNISALSNVITATTNSGPAIAVNEASQDIILDIDINTGTTASHDITILNNADGLLRWEYFTRHRNTEFSFSSTGLHYPQIKNHKIANLGKVGLLNISTPKPAATITPMAFDEIEKRYVSYTDVIIGEDDLTLTNSSATQFFVNEEDGFNLTRVLMYLKHDPAKGPVIVEIYKGTSINKQGLIHAQEYMAGGNYEHNASIDLTEQLYFQKGETFWVVFHVPSGNKYPLGIGWELENQQSDYCYMSFDLGKSWTRLHELLTGKPNKEKYVWSTVAVSSNPYLGEYITLNPSSGEIAGMGNGSTTLSVEAASLINGTYRANVVLTSNDAVNKELRVPVTLNVSGQTPQLSAIETLDFSSVFQGASKELTVTISNTGLGNYNDVTFEITNPHYEIVGWPSSEIKAKEDLTLTVKYTPDGLGNDNGLLRLTSASNPKALSIILFGVSAPPAAMTISPLSQTMDDIAIGDEVTATITVENTGQAALKYFVPGFDNSSISENWTEDYHSYGYQFRTSYPEEANPLSYSFEDISTTGENITGYFKLNDNRYWELDMGFTFPYYKDNMTKLYVSCKGFTTFSPDVNPINTPSLNGAPWSPKGYISMLGQYTDLSAGGEILYQVEPDRVIVQYNAIGDSWSGFNTAQMVLYADGNIRFYYENIGQPLNYMTILIEDFDQTDGVLINSWQKSTPVYSGLALGFDYPGPNIITAITNAGGILMPGETASLEIDMNTSTLPEGEIKRFINIISNDPLNGQQNALVNLNVVDGGVSDITISENEIAFGDVFQGATVSRKISMKNNGTAAVTLTSVTLDNGSFIINGNPSAVIKPGLAVLFEVVLPTGTKANLTDILHITDNEGTAYTITLSGNVVDAPAVVTDLTPIVETLVHGETSSHPMTFENTGLGTLEVVATGTHWLTLEKNLGPSSTPNYTYTYKLYNDGTNYQWYDIRKTGTQLPFAEEDFFDPRQYWRTVELPRPVSFYGISYTTMYVAENGLISFDEPNEIPFFTERFPTETDYKTLLAPYWAFASLDTYTNGKEDVGIFTKIDDDKIIISWEYLQDNFGGMADPMSAQVIFYNNGTMKFQYKINGSTDAISNNANIGMQNYDKSDVVTINAYSNLPHGNGLAFIITPAEKHVVAPGTTLDATIKINTANIYAGTYSDGLTIRTNVPNMESLFKPVELTVTGDAVINVPESIDLGSIMAVETSEGPASYSKEFSIKNIGVAELSFTGMNIQSYAPEYIVEMYVYSSGPWGGWSWSDVNWLWEWPVVKPGEELKMRVTSMPTVAGIIAENLIINSNLGETIVPITGTVVIPPVLSVNTESVYSEVSNLTDTDTKLVSVDNAAGQSPLTYSLSIDYNRTTATSIATTETMATQAGPSILTSVAASSKIGPLSTQTVFNRVFAHENASAPSNYLGYGGQYDFKVATRFNAGNDGFNVTHILAYYRAPEATSGTVDYEVRAGGSNISEAKILSQGSFTYVYAGGETGEWLEIKLTNSATVYPNEDFYIIVNYPMALEYPQGYIEETEAAANRYQYFYEGTWYDIQEGFAGAAFLMRAAEETFVSNSWVSINGATEGTIEAGASLDIQLDFKAALGDRGDQFATLNINTNDPVNPSGEVPVTFHINAGPQFTGVPATVRVSEGATKTVTIQVEDVEDHSFTIAPKQVYTGVSHSLQGETMTITLTPGYDAAGTYELVYEGTDALGAVSSMILNVDVINTNRNPEFIGEDVMSFTATGLLNQYTIDDFFSDPDGDEISFELTNSNSSSVVVFASANEFILRPIEVGETKLMFTVTDSQGGVTKDTITVAVDVVLGAEDGFINNGVGVYPNPVEEMTNVTFSYDWTGDVNLEIIDGSGKQLFTKQLDTRTHREIQLNVSTLKSGFYILKASSNGKNATIKLIKK